MADGYDRYENEGSSGSSFVMGLLTGTVLGAGLGMLFAPKSGSELRTQLSEQAGSLANSASESYRRATETANEWAEKGREVSRDVYGRAREAVSRGMDEAQRYVNQTAEGNAPATSSPGAGEGSYGGGERMRGTEGTTSGASYGSGAEDIRNPTIPRRS